MDTEGYARTTEDKRGTSTTSNNVPLYQSSRTFGAICRKCRTTQGYASRQRITSLVRSFAPHKVVQTYHRYAIGMSKGIQRKSLSRHFCPDISFVFLDIHMVCSMACLHGTFWGYPVGRGVKKSHPGVPLVRALYILCMHENSIS